MVTEWLRTGDKFSAQICITLVETSDQLSSMNFTSSAHDHKIAAEEEAAEKALTYIQALNTNHYAEFARSQKGAKGKAKWRKAEL